MHGVHQAGSNILKDLPFLWVGLKPSTYRWLMIILGSIIPKSLSNVIQISSFSDVAPKFSQNYPYETVAALHWLKGIYAIYLDLPHVWWKKGFRYGFFGYTVPMNLFCWFFHFFPHVCCTYHPLRDYQKHNFSPVGVSVCLKTRYPQIHCWTIILVIFHWFIISFHDFPLIVHNFPHTVIFQGSTNVAGGIPCTNCGPSECARRHPTWSVLSRVPGSSLAPLTLVNYGTCRDLL